jgi:hypothetical protein
MELNTFLDLQNPPKTSYLGIIMNATVFASPSLTPSLTVILMLFSASEHSAKVLQVFEESNLKVKIIEDYRPKQCFGVPHALHVEVGQWAVCKHLDVSLTKYAVYHGEERKKWTAPDLWANNIVLVTYDTVTLLYESRCEALFKATWFCIILDKAQ